MAAGEIVVNVQKTDENGVTYFAEQDGFAAPAFAFRIDGITELNTIY